MDNAITRIESIELNNFKNVEKGSINFQSYGKDNLLNKQSEILGIYGQNGSGKTALVDAIWIIKQIMTGKSFPENAVDFIKIGSETASIEVIFSIETLNTKGYLYYELQFKANEDKSIRITKEKLSCKLVEANEWQKKRIIIDYSPIEDSNEFKPSKHFKLLVSGNSANLVDIGVAQKLAVKQSTSFIFGDELESVLERTNSFENYAKLILQLKEYAKLNLLLFKNNHTGLINLNFLMPFSFKVNVQNKFIQADIGIGLTEPTVLPKNIHVLVNQIIDQMNMVLKTIVPGLTIAFKDHGPQTLENGGEGQRVELLSIRGEDRIPLRCESEGIKRIISILSTLIELFNNPSVCLVIDELDSGIYEYLLGELLHIINQEGKGQLIFTSHNLRPLEMLDANAIIFTTTNPANRYIRFTNVRENNNLRSLYYRSINLGGQSEALYAETNSYEISHAFRIAGQVKLNE